MNPYTGNLMVLANGMAAPAGFYELPEALEGAAMTALAGRSETRVDLRKGSPLADWAKQKRKEKIAAKSRRKNRR